MHSTYSQAKQILLESKLLGIIQNAISDLAIAVFPFLHFLSSLAIILVLKVCYHVKSFCLFVCF